METKPSIVSTGDALKQRRCLNLNARALYYMGVWPHDDGPKSFITYWRLCLPPIQMFRFVYTIAFNTVSLSIVWGTWDRVTIFAGAIVLYVACIIRYGSLYAHRRSLAAIFSELEGLCGPAMVATGPLREIARYTERLAGGLAAAFIGGFLVSVVFLISSILADGYRKRELPLRLWLPYNYTSTPVFEVTLISMQVLGALDMFMVMYPSIVFVGCIIHIVGQYKLLRYKLDNIRIHVEEKLLKTRQSKRASVSLDMENESGRWEPSGWARVRELTTVQRQVREVTTVQRQVAVEDIERQSLRCQDMMDAMNEVIVTLAEGVEGRPKPNEGAMTGSDDLGGRGWFKTRQLFKKRREDEQTFKARTQVEMEKYLKHCAKHHQTILRLTKDIERPFTVLLRFSTFTDAIIGLFGLYVTILAPKFDYKVILIMIFILAVYIELLFFCWFGNEITDESEKLREAVYGCEWYGASESFKRSIRIMISRTNKSEVLKTGGVPLSMKSFRFICRTGFYLHNFMVKIIHGVKINDKV